MSNLFKEKAYKLLYEKYRSLYDGIFEIASKAKEYGQKDDQLKVINTIIEKEDYHKSGYLWSKSDAEVVRVLEYLLDDDQKVK